MWMLMIPVALLSRPAAWRGLQNPPTDFGGKLHTSPPCLRNLQKAGSGHAASWTLASFQDEQGATRLEVRLALDANPEVPCCKLLFFDADAPHGPEELRKLPIRYLSVISYRRDE